MPWHPVVTLLLLIADIVFTVFMANKHGAPGFWAGVFVGIFALWFSRPIVQYGLWGLFMAFYYLIFLVGFGLVWFFWELNTKHNGVLAEGESTKGFGASKFLSLIGGWCEQITFTQAFTATIAIGVIIWFFRLIYKIIKWSDTGVWPE